MKRRTYLPWRHRTLWAWLLAPLAALAGRNALLHAEPAPATAAESPADEKKAPAAGEKWVRLLKDKDDEPVALETAIVRYVKADKIVAGKPADEYKEYVDL